MAGYIAVYPPDSKERIHKLKNCIRVAQGYEYVEGDNPEADEVFDKFKDARLRTKGDTLELKRAFERLERK